MKKLLLICAVMLGLNGCVALSSTTLSPKIKNEKLLPPLVPVFDGESFFTHYPSSITLGSGAVIGSTAIMNSSTFSNPTLGDFDFIFQRDVDENICVPDMSYGEKKGTIRCSMYYAEYKEKFGWMIPSGLTLFIGCLLGMPSMSSESGLQIEVFVFDGNNKLVGKYRSDIHKRKHRHTLYNTVKPRANQREMFIACMEDVKRLIASDYDRLNDTLE